MLDIVMYKLAFSLTNIDTESTNELCIIHTFYKVRTDFDAQF